LAVTILSRPYQFPTDDRSIVIGVSTRKDTRDDGNEVIRLVAQDSHTRQADKSDATDQNSILNQSLALPIPNSSQNFLHHNIPLIEVEQETKMGSESLIEF